MAKSSLNNNKQNYFKNLFFKQNFKIHSLNIGDHKMKTNKTTGQSSIQLFFIFLLLLLFSIPTMAQNRAQSDFTFVNNTGEKATDLHIKFKNAPTKIPDPQNIADYTYQEPHGTFKNGNGSGSNNWDLAAGNGLGVAKGASVKLYWSTTGSAAEVESYKWTNDNNLDPKTGVIAVNGNRSGWIQCSSVQPSAGDGFIELAIANETFTFSCPPGLSGADMAIAISNFIEADIEYLHVSSLEDNTVMFYASYLSEPIDNFTCNINQDSSMTTEFKYLPEVIPTLSEWGVIILLLLVVAMGMVFLYQRQPAMAVAGGAEISNAKPHLFNRKLFTKVFAITLLIGFAGLLGAYLWFGQITSADPLGVFVSAAVVAYMVQLGMLKKEGRG